MGPPSLKSLGTPFNPLGTLLSTGMGVPGLPLIRIYQKPWVASTDVAYIYTHQHNPMFEAGHATTAVWPPGGKKVSWSGKKLCFGRCKWASSWFFTEIRKFRFLIPSYWHWFPFRYQNNLFKCNDYWLGDLLEFFLNPSTPPPPPFFFVGGGWMLSSLLFVVHYVNCLLTNFTQKFWQPH